MGEICMSKLEARYPLEGFIDTHIHTSPDVKPRIFDDVKAAFEASNEKMGAIILKSHVESTSGRARIAEKLTGLKVIGGVTLNKSVGGLNPAAVEAVAMMGGRIIWFPTTSHNEIVLESDLLEDVLHVIAENDLVLATGHLTPIETLKLIDIARSLRINRILVNHPFTTVVGADIYEQKEMAKYAYLEHCFVACMEKHDNIDPGLISQGIKEVGPKKCIMATDFGQSHNPCPVEGLKMFIDRMLELGITWDDVQIMCRENPLKLLF